MPAQKRASPNPESSEVASELARYFERNGYVRRQNPDRRLHDGYSGYKKGDEVRLTANDRAELLCLVKLLKRAKFNPGRPFGKGRQYRLPLYGRQAVRRFLKLIHHPPLPPAE